MTHGLIIAGRRVPVPGVTVITWEDDPRVPKAVHGKPREAREVTGSVAHTSRGDEYVVDRDTSASTKGLAVARYLGRRNDDQVSAHISIAGSGIVYQMADLALWRANHAGTANGFTFGVEVAQDTNNPNLTRAQVSAFVAVMTTAHEVMGLAKQIPMVAGAHVIKDVKAWLSRKSGGQQRAFSGCAGHRCTSASRGEWDPGNPLMEALRLAGFVGVTPEAMTCGSNRCEDEDRPDGRDKADAPVVARVAFPLPSWIDPAKEIDASEDLPDDLGSFVRAQALELEAIGVTGERAAELLAHAATECGRGRRAHGHNMGGIKAKEREFLDAAAKGAPLWWWRDLGHLDAGDDEVEFYRAFSSDNEFWRYFIKRFLGGPSSPPTSERYTAMGRAFWGSTPTRWVVELHRSGYKGSVRQKEIHEIRDPEKHESVIAHRRLVAKVRELLATVP